MNWANRVRIRRKKGKTVSPDLPLFPYPVIAYQNQVTLVTLCVISTGSSFFFFFSFPTAFPSICTALHSACPTGQPTTLSSYVRTPLGRKNTVTINGINWRPYQVWSAEVELIRIHESSPHPCPNAPSDWPLQPPSPSVSNSRERNTRCVNAESQVPSVFYESISYMKEFLTEKEH